MNTRSLQLGIALTTLALIVMGLAIQTSVAHAMGERFHLVQARWLFVALVASVVIFVIPYPWLLRRGYVVYGGSLLLLALVPVIGVSRNFSQRWIEVGGFSLQPSELMKFAFVLGMARFLRFRRDFSRFSSLLAPGLLLALPVTLIFGQPDLGTTLLFIPAALAMLFVAGASRRHMSLILLGGILLALVGYLTLLEPYQKERILSTFLRHRLTKAERLREGYQLEQAIRSIGIGGMAGEGLGQGIQNRLNMLPYRHNDFIFAVIAEETGFLGGLLLFALILLLLFLVFRVAWITRDPGGRLIVVGVGTLFGTQSVVHIGVNLGLVPTTGMTLPFVSCGGTSLLAFVGAITLVLNVAQHRVAVFSGDLGREQVARLTGLMRWRRRGGEGDVRTLPE